MKILKTIIILFIIFTLVVSCNDKENILKERDLIDKNIDNDVENVSEINDNTINRPETKEITWVTEGEQNTEVFQLVNIPTLPFTTYVPKKDCTITSTEDKLVINWNNIGYIEVTFLPEGTTEQKAIDYIQEIVERYPQSEKVIKKSPMINVFYEMRDLPKDSNVLKVAYTLLGNYNDRYFIIYWHIDDMGNGEPFGELSYQIFKEWRWKDTNKPLNYPFE